MATTHGPAAEALLDGAEYDAETGKCGGGLGDKPGDNGACNVASASVCVTKQTFNTRVLMKGGVSSGACSIDTMRGMCVFDTRVLRSHCACLFDRHDT